MQCDYGYFIVAEFECRHPRGRSTSSRFRAVQCALERGAGGCAYFINDRETTTFREFIAALANLQELSIDELGSISYRVAFSMGWLMEIGAAIIFSDRDPPLSRTLVRMIGREFTTSDAAARSELGYFGRISRVDGLGT
jgi:nucleoside-diphosphate-sugar epimerase